MEFREVTDFDKTAWDDLAGHPMQTWAWGEFRNHRQHISRLGVFEKDRLVRGYLVIWTQIGIWTIGYVPMGVVPQPEDVEVLKTLGRKRKAIFIRMEPLSQSGFMPGAFCKSRGLFKPESLWWNLEQSETNMLSTMHPKGRYNIKVAKRHGVIVYEDGSAEGLETHIQLLLETAKRQGVRFHTAEYHRQLWATLHPRLFFAKFKDEIIASAMVFIHKNWAYYAYGGNSLEHREVMASTLLLWEIALKLQKNGVKIFDLWGNEPGTGFGQFKEKFGANKIKLLGSFDLPILSLIYPLFRTVEELRWKLRHI